MRKQVLFDNNLEVMPGEIVILTGPSGSGKTTLLTLLGALRTVQEGQVSVLGRELSGLSAAELVKVRRGIGFIFQAHNLFGSLTAYQNVQLALELQEPRSQVRHERALEILNALGLGHRVHYKPEALSGGQRQRVAIARALANRPKLILADEPTAALDEKSGRDVVSLLQKLAREEGSTSVIVTHDNRILDVADRLVHLVDGRIKSNVLVKESVAVCASLSKCSVLKRLPSEMLTNVAGKMVRERFAAGTRIVQQGEVGNKFYLLRRGSVEVIRGEGTPAQKVVAVLREGSFFGEMALLSGAPRSATVVAQDEVETYTLGATDFAAAVAASPSFKEELYKAYFHRQ
jgi:putative ABC transport system ATP-binding protein